MLFPSALIIGASALHDAGWTTQIPSTTDIAVPSSQTYPSLPGFELHPRPHRWYKRFHEGIDFQSGFPRLKPEYALADMWSHKHIWQPDWDDLEESEIDTESLKSVFIDLDVDWPDRYREQNTGPDLLIPA